MNIYFGKISKKVDFQQIEEGYYISPKDSTRFGDIEIGDYAFIIGGDKIQFWKAREWGDKEGKECLWFDILNKDLGIKNNQFIALGFFKLTKPLIVLTTRSARNRAFFKLETLRELTPDYLSNSDTYKNQDLYRKIIVHKSNGTIEDDSDNIQLYYEDDELKLVPADFFDPEIITNFKDNLAALGSGSKRKDNVIKKLKSQELSAINSYTYEEISILGLYDTLFCEYREQSGKYYLVGAYWDGSNPSDQTERFIEEGIWINGYDDKFSDEVNSIPVGSSIAIKSVFTRNKTTSLMAIKARGIVVENHKNGKLIDVEWENDFTPFEVDFPGSYWATIKEVKKQQHINAIWYNAEPSYNEDEEGSTPIAKEEFALNQILYGPPGTGKTYNTVLHAAQIIEASNDITNHIVATEIFNHHLGERIEFITFHQSYSYEDFIQGLRPDIENQGHLSFERKDGIFKRMAVNALFEYYKVLKKRKAASKPQRQKLDNNEIYLDFVEHLKTSKNNQFKTASDTVVQIEDFSKNNNIDFSHKNSSRRYTVSGNRLLKLFGSFNDVESIKNISNDIREVIGGCNATVYWTALNEFIKFYNQYDSALDTQEEESYEEVSYETKKKLLSTVDLKELRSVDTSEVPNYAIVIDEINRANISRVFGELITLIEPDKRSHGMIPLTCTLPSEEAFIVPSNLHIIGTMNTADKSIALLDIALRRRFRFLPMYPKYDLDYEAKEVLRKINEKIIDMKGHDFQIGHAYFMGDDFNLTECINNSVIPLLLEYFLNDESAVREIIAHAGLTVIENGWPIKISE